MKRLLLSLILAMPKIRKVLLCSLQPRLRQLKPFCGRLFDSRCEIASIAGRAVCTCGLSKRPSKSSKLQDQSRRVQRNRKSDCHQFVSQNQQQHHSLTQFLLRLLQHSNLRPSNQILLAGKLPIHLLAMTRASPVPADQPPLLIPPSELALMCRTMRIAVDR